MHPFITAELAAQRQNELRAEARRARLARDANRARTGRTRVMLWSRIARKWRHRRSSDALSAPPAIASRRCFDLDELASKLAADGPETVEPELRRFVDHSPRLSAFPLLVSILADRTEPAVVRQRAFGRILTELADSQRHPITESHEASNAA